MPTNESVERTFDNSAGSFKSVRSVSKSTSSPAQKNSSKTIQEEESDVYSDSDSQTFSSPEETASSHSASVEGNECIRYENKFMAVPRQNVVKLNSVGPEADANSRGLNMIS